MLGRAFGDHRSRLVLITAVAMAVLVALAAAVVVTQRGDRASANEPRAEEPRAEEPPASLGIDPMKGTCPKVEPEKLPPDALAGATETALAHFENVEEAESQYAVSAERGEYATHNEFYKNCTDLSPQRGRLLQERSVEVHLIWPKMFPSASMSQHSVFVARFDSEYRVWARVR